MGTRNLSVKEEFFQIIRNIEGKNDTERLKKWKHGEDFDEPVRRHEVEEMMQKFNPMSKEEIEELVEQEAGMSINDVESIAEDVAKKVVQDEKRQY